MKSNNQQSGFVLIFAVVVLGAAAIILGGVFSYLSFTARATMMNIAKSDCRFAAQSVIDRAKVGIDTAFTAYTGKNATVRIGPKSGDAYDWFEVFSDPWTIGRGTLAAGTAYRLPLTPGYTSTNVLGCVVTPRFGGFTRDGDSSWAIVSIVATASLTTNGVMATVTIEERVRFATERSKVFDYAYFVNNYGWFEGSTCTANGDVRANGDLYLGDCTINGEAYAATNSALHVNGDITIKKYAGFQDLSAYWRSAGTSMIRPSSPTSTGGMEWSGGYEVPESAEKRCHPHLETGIPMPWIGDLQNEYVPYAKELGGKLSGGKRYSVSADGTVTSKNNETVNAHYNGVGPSGDATLADNGALVLEGTQTNPIRIDGPVVVDNDVIIKGYVTGQGTLYSGRNIHIVGNITYADPPQWPHPDTNPTNTAAKNATKDLVGFAAKGNIVLGSPTRIEASDQVGGLLRQSISTTPYVQKYACDPSDANIGYPSTFGGSYLAKDGLKKVEVQIVEVVTGTGERQVQQKTQKTATQTLYQNKYTGEIYYSRPSDYYNNYNNYYTYKTINKGDRYYVTEYVTETYEIKEKQYQLVDVNDKCHYYDTVCYNKLISELYGSSITRIDGVLYNNHGIFGSIGDCTFNGSLICRNEGIIYSGNLKINWDIRLKSGSAEALSNAMGLPVGVSPPATVAWHESADNYYSTSGSTNWVPSRITY